jgi:four helix bundle suffix protein
LTSFASEDCQCARGEPRREALIARRCSSADEVARWVKQQSSSSSASSQSSVEEAAAIAALTLVEVASNLLGRQLAYLSRAFEQEGGFTERLYRVRSGARRGGC